MHSTHLEEWGLVPTGVGSGLTGHGKDLKEYIYNCRLDGS